MDIRKLRTPLQWGPRRAVIWYLLEFAKRILNLNLFRLWVAQGPDDAWSADLPEIPLEFPTRCLEPQELIPYITPDNDLPAEFLDEAQKKGDECTAVFHQGKVVSYGFDSYKRTLINEALDIDIPEGLRYGYKGWTHPDYRQQGISRYRAKAKFDRYGFRRLKGVWYVEYHNYASLLNNRYEPPDQRPLYLGIIGWIRIFGHVIPFNSRRAKWLGTVLLKKQAPSRRTYPYT